MQFQHLENVIEEEYHELGASRSVYWVPAYPEIYHKTLFKNIKNNNQKKKKPSRPKQKS